MPNDSGGAIRRQRIRLHLAGVVQRHQETSSALKVLLKRREQDKLEVENNLLTNVRDLVMPTLEKLQKISSDKKQTAFLNILEGNLTSIISPFIRGLDAQYLRLSPAEIQVAYHVKDGKTS